MSEKNHLDRTQFPHVGSYSELYFLIQSYHVQKKEGVSEVKKGLWDKWLRLSGRIMKISNSSTLNRFFLHKEAEEKGRLFAAKKCFQIWHSQKYRKLWQNFAARKIKSKVFHGGYQIGAVRAYWAANYVWKLEDFQPDYSIFLQALNFQDTQFHNEPESVPIPSVKKRKTPTSSKVRVKKVKAKSSHHRAVKKQEEEEIEEEILARDINLDSENSQKNLHNEEELILEEDKSEEKKEMQEEETLVKVETSQIDTQTLEIPKTKTEEAEIQAKQEYKNAQTQKSLEKKNWRSIFLIVVGVLLAFGLGFFFYLKPRYFGNTFPVVTEIQIEMSNSTAGHTYLVDQTPANSEPNEIVNESCLHQLPKNKTEAILNITSANSTEIPINNTEEQKDKHNGEQKQEQKEEREKNEEKTTETPAEKSTEKISEKSKNITKSDEENKMVNEKEVEKQKPKKRFGLF